MRDISTKVNGVDTLDAGDFNANLGSELENVVTDSGQTLDPAGGADTDLDMLGKAMALYGSAAWYYADSGAANAYVLTRAGTLQSIPAYVDGAVFMFKVGNTNTTASTVNTDGLGAIDVVGPDGLPLAGGELRQGEYVSLRYNSSSGDAEIVMSFSAMPADGVLIRGQISGLKLENAADANHDITINEGACVDSTNLVNIRLGSATTKRLDATWAAGTAAGGLFTGSIAADTTYHVFLIKKDSDNTIDSGFDTSVTAANIPAGYTAFRRIGSVVTNGSANIINFIQNGDNFTYMVAVADVNELIADTLAKLHALTVPTGIKVEAIINATFDDDSPTSDTFFLVTDPAITDTVASIAAFTTMTQANTDTQGVSTRTFTNTSGQIRVRASATTAAHDVIILTMGFVDNRDRDI